MSKAANFLALQFRYIARLIVVASALLLACAAQAADPVRGSALFATPARQGLLPCADCHSENPIVNNFGNIWSGRNAMALIERAVQSNTGGMGVFQGVYGSSEFADIAAYLGNAPNALAFAPTVTGVTSAARTVTISSSLKVGIDVLSLAVEGDFVLAATSCGGSVERFSSCTVEVAFRPTAAGARVGTLVISHAGTPTPVRLPLGGEGLSPPAVAQVLPARVDFGTAGMQRFVEVSNLSEAPLRLVSIDSAEGEFAITGGSCVAGLTLATGQRCSVSLRAPPRNGATQHGTLNIVHDGVGNGAVVELAASGSGTAPTALRADAAELDFGSQVLGTSVPPRLVNVVNAGAVAVSLREVSASDPAFPIDGSTCAAGARLAPGQACQVAVAFRPTREGPVSGELRIASTDPAPDLRVGLSARAGSSALSVAPARLALRAAIGGTARASVALVNTGSSSWRIAALGLTGPEAADFALAPGGSCVPGAVLTPGANCLATMAFTPRTIGARLARLRIDTDAGTADVDLAGVGSSVAMGQLWLDAASVDFGAQPIGQADAVRTVSVHNRGDADLRWTQVAVTGADAAHFSLGGNCTPGGLLVAGGSCRAELRFAAGRDGEHAASLALWHEFGAPALVSLRGRGAAAPSAVLSVDRLFADFGRRPLSSITATQRIRLRNLGAAAAPPLAIAIDNAAFEVPAAAHPCLRELPPGGSCELEVGFRASREGRQLGTLTITGAGLPAITVSLAGEAVTAAPLLAWQGTADLPPLGAFVGTPASGATWTLVNHGNAPSAPLRWLVFGPAAGEFSFADGTTCSAGRVLDARAGCTVRMAFHPRAAGRREARLVLLGDSLDPLPLAGQGMAAAVADLQAMPAAVVFPARMNSTAAPQRVRLANDGAAEARIGALDIEGAAFSFAASAADACGGELRLLLPGEACELTVAWDGSAAGALGGRVSASAAPDGFGATVALRVHEDPAQRTNVGAGGGGASHWAWLLALALLLAARRTVRSEWPHAHVDHDRT